MVMPFSRRLCESELNATREGPGEVAPPKKGGGHKDGQPMDTSRKRGGALPLNHILSS